LVKELDLTSHVVFAGFRTDIRQILAAADVFTMPSFEEPCAVAFLEAMAMKKPVIALRSGGTPKLIDHGKAGLLSDPHDINQLAKNIIALIENPALRHQMGDYGRQRVEQYFTPRRLAAEVEGVYERILGTAHEPYRSPQSARHNTGPNRGSSNVPPAT
jgi:glycosyltransferase involved in cell wall biosynthesis